MPDVIPGTRGHQQAKQEWAVQQETYSTGKGSSLLRSDQCHVGNARVKQGGGQPMQVEESRAGEGFLRRRYMSQAWKKVTGWAHGCLGKSVPERFRNKEAGWLDRVNEGKSIRR